MGVDINDGVRGGHVGGFLQVRGVFADCRPWELFKVVTSTDLSSNTRDTRAATSVCGISSLSTSCPIARRLPSPNLYPSPLLCPDSTLAAFSSKNLKRRENREIRGLNTPTSNRTSLKIPRTWTRWRRGASVISRNHTTLPITHT